MDFIELKEALRLFGKTVVANSKKNLDSNSPLAKSIKFNLRIWIVSRSRCSW